MIGLHRPFRDLATAVVGAYADHTYIDAPPLELSGHGLGARRICLVRAHL